MFINYFKTAARNLVKNRIFSTVNILGLTLGFTCFILLSLYVANELSYDRFHSNSDQIYRVVQKITDKDGTTRKVAGVAPLVGTESVQQYPEVVDETRLIEIGRVTVGNEPLSRAYERIWIAEPNFFRFFDFKFIHGDPATALSAPDNLVITESVARKYFGGTDVVGKTLYTNRYEARISGVIRDFPANSHIDMNVIHTMPTWEREISDWKKWVSSNWTSNAFITYLRMTPGFDRKAFENKLTGLVMEHYEGVNYTSAFILQPLTDIHLFSGDIEGGLNAGAGDPLYLYMFGVVGLLVLAIACFNYMNLSTAAAAARTREVAMRKTMGADRKQLIMQFTGEALLFTVISLLLAVVLIETVLPMVNSLAGKNLELSLNDPLLAGVLFAAVIGSGILSSLYPAFYLSGVNPVNALKRDIVIGGKKFSLRKILVVTQFTASIVMISATIIIYQQLSYLEHKQLGFDVDNLLTVDINSGILRSRFESIKQEFKNVDGVQSVSVSSRVPGEWKTFPVADVDGPGNKNTTQMIFVGADEDFLGTFEIGLIAGRNLTNDPADSNSVLISESALRALDMENPVGKTVTITGTMWSGDYAEQDEPYSPRIVGVIKDFYFQSFRKSRMPIMLASYRNPVHRIDYYTLRIKTDDWDRTIRDLQAVNYRFDPENPMEYHFLDAQFDRFYQADKIRGQLFMLFSGVIIFIACLGLFALSSFAIKNRTKEIGVRKVLGASTTRITWLISGEFAMLVAFAFVAGAPLAYWAVSSWLQEFAYRIEISLWVFVVSGLAALLIALATISFQTIRAALGNPVDSLRYE